MKLFCARGLAHAALWLGFSAFALAVAPLFQGLGQASDESPEAGQSGAVGRDSTLWTLEQYEALSRSKPLSDGLAFPLSEKAAQEPLARETVWEQADRGRVYMARKVETIDGRLYTWVHAAREGDRVVFYRKWIFPEKIVRETFQEEKRYRVEETVGFGTPEAKRSTSFINRESNSLLNPDISYALAQDMPKLLKGEAVEYNIVTPTHGRSFDFSFKMEKQDETGITLVMAASNFLIRALVDPALYVVQPNEPFRLLRYRGRTNFTPEFFGLEKPEIDLRVAYRKPEL